ncbi:MAG: hypothetical protein ABH891_04635 [Candidatus Omnitrophota bacterium]
MTGTLTENGDFGPPTWTFDDANFTGPAGIENINIEIIGARHNDFSYDPAAWNSNPYEPEAEAQEINRKTNLFMRDLYKFALQDQTNAGVLSNFPRTESVVSYNSSRNIWVVDFGDV